MFSSTLDALSRHHSKLFTTQLDALSRHHSKLFTTKREMTQVATLCNYFGLELSGPIRS